MVWIESDKIILPGVSSGVSSVTTITLRNGSRVFIGRVSDEVYLMHRLCDPAFKLLVGELMKRFEDVSELQEVKHIDFGAVEE